MENELLEQLGINWGLFLSQAVNFFILLGVLWFFVYRPLLKIIKERNQKIKTGLEKAEQAGIRLKEVDEIGKEIIKKAEAQSVGIIKSTEEKAKVLDKELQEKMDQKQKSAQELLRQSVKKQQEEAKKDVLKGAGELIKKAILKTVELKPDAVDEALVKKALEKINEK